MMKSLNYISVDELVDNINDGSYSVSSEQVNDCLIMWRKVSYGDAGEWGGLTLLPISVVLKVMNTFMPELLEWDFSDGEKFPEFEYTPETGDTGGTFVAIEEPVCV